MGIGATPCRRGVPYKLTSPTSAAIIAGKFRKDIRARRVFARPTGLISADTPVESTPTKIVEKKSPDRRVRRDCRYIGDMRRANVGFPTSKFYPVRAPSVESISRLLAPTAASYPDFDIGMGKRDIASALLPLRLHPALSLLMCKDFPGFHIGRPRDVVLLYLVMPFLSE